MSIRTSINHGLLQSDLDANYFSIINLGTSVGGGTDVLDSGITPLVNGQNYIDVEFSTEQVDTDWELTQVSVTNTTDAAPFNIWPGIITVKTTTGFRMQLNALPDSSHYFLHWAIVAGMTVMPPTEVGLPDSATATELMNSVVGTRTAIASLAPNTGNWFDSQTYDPCIIVNPTDSNQLLMFFSGMGAPVAGGEQKIGRATASITAPTVWTVSNGGSPVLSAALAWETGGDGLRADSVVYNPSDSKIYLFYTAKAGTTGVGLATSTDLGLTWTKLGQILVPSGDEVHTSQLAVLLEGTTLHGIYAYRTSGATLPAYRYASASTSSWTTWTKQPGDVYADTGRYHEFHQLLKIGSTYLLNYESGTTAVPYDIRFASSSSPLSGWTIGPVVPFLEKSGVDGAFDEFHTATAAVTVINGVYYIIYCGAMDHDQPYGTNHWQMGIAPLLVP